MREMRRQDRKLSEQDAYRVLRESEYGVLATVNEDGSPYAVPMAGELVDGVLYFHSALKGQKLDNIAHDPRACYTCVLYAENQPAEFTYVYASCVVHGRLRVVQSEEERMLAINAICRKYSADHMGSPAHERVMRGMPVIVLLALEIEAIEGKANRGRLLEG